MNVGHFGAANALIDPAHDIAQNALGIVVQFLLDIGRRPVGPHRHGDRENVGQFRRFAVGDGLASGGHINLVIMGGVQRGGGGRWHPGGGGTRFGVACLQAEHFGHTIRHGPHALADLRPAGHAASQPHIDIVVLISCDPCGGFHIRLADHGACLDGSVHFIARAIQEAGVDEAHAILRRADHFLQIHRGTAFLVHDAHFQRTA